MTRHLTRFLSAREDWARRPSMTQAAVWMLIILAILFLFVDTKSVTDIEAFLSHIDE